MTFSGISTSLPHPCRTPSAYLASTAIALFGGLMMTASPVCAQVATANGGSGTVNTGTCQQDTNDDLACGAASTASSSAAAGSDGPQVSPSTSIGYGSTATGQLSTALGSQSSASGLDSIAIGPDAQSTNQATVAIGAGSIASGVDGIAEGDQAVASGGYSSAYGEAATASGNSSTAIGPDAIASGGVSTSIGAGSRASGYDSTAVGGRASGDNASAFGNIFTSATGNAATATGAQATASGDFSSAYGDTSTAAGPGDIALGAAATTSASDGQTGGNIAIGSSSGAAVGTLVNSQNEFVGTATTANGGNAVAIGTAAQATGTNAVAIGSGARVSGSNSVAIGAGSSDGGQSNVVSVGSAGADRRITNVAAGVSGTDAVNLVQLAASAGSTLASANAYTDTQVAAVQFDLSHLRHQVNQGIAAAMAQTSAPFPSAPGKTSYAANTAIYRGEVAFSASLSYRLDTGAPFALTGGVSYSGGDGVGGRVGVAGEF